MSSSSGLTEAFYRVEVRDRITGDVVPGCVFDEGVGSFRRGLDLISDAEFSTVTGPDCDDCNCEPIERAHELAIIRDDRREPTWVGPITRIIDKGDEGELRLIAQDRLFWWDGIQAAQAVDNPQGSEIDVTLLISEYIRQLSAGSSGRIDSTFLGKPDGVPPLSGLEIASFIQVGDSIYEDFRALAETVFDFTMAGPHLYWGAPEIPISRGPRLTNSHWTQTPTIDRDASEVVSQVVVTGEDGVRAVFPAEHTDIGFGIKTGFVSDSDINSTSEALDRAETIYEANKRPTGFIVTGLTSLSPSFPVSIHGLIPGRKFPVSIDGRCLSVEAELQLFNLVVEFGSVSEPDQRIKELRVAADFSQIGALGSSTSQSAAV